MTNIITNCSDHHHQVNNDVLIVVHDDSGVMKWKVRRRGCRIIVVVSNLLETVMKWQLMFHSSHIDLDLSTCANPKIVVLF